MIKPLLLTLLISLRVISAEVIPPDTNSVNALTHLKFFKRLTTKSTLLFSYSLGLNSTLPNSNHFTLSYRQRLNRHFRVGLTTTLAKGLRHNEDWIRLPTQWNWQETRDRYEFIYSGFIQFKKLLSSYGKYIFKTRVHYQVNNFNNQQDLIIKLGLISLLTSKVSVPIQLDFQIPVNYQRSFLREFWIYTAPGLQINPNIFLALKLSYGVEVWNESKNFFDRTQKEYKNTNSVLRVGPLLNFYY